ncbi:cupin domain-containing protein [Georgenia sp. AZ-5]|uniref:cupin domain-containing protein n=1 Tax=Georgenia sp. AZ-5 TaxID=3367526 RepID=UPI003754F6A7
MAGDVRPEVLSAGQGQQETWDDPVKGKVSFVTTFSSGATATTGLTAGVSELAPEGWLGLHRHTPPEVYYVLEGEGLVVIDGAEHPVSAGSAVFIPGDAEHGIRNTGSQTLRFHYTFPVDSLQEVDYRFSEG